LSEEGLAIQKKSLSAVEWGRFFLITASTDESREERKSCFYVLSERMSEGINQGIISLVDKRVLS